MNLNESIINIRCELQAKGIKQSGLNKFAGFKYYELSDFLPTLNDLMLKYQINDIITIDKEYATLTLAKGDEKNIYTIPFFMFDVPKNKNGQDSMQQIQYLGALNTYCKRYLYLNAFGITDGEIIDSLNNQELTENLIPKINELVKIKQVDILKFLNHFKVSNVGELNPQQQQQAIQMLQKK